ncbi:MAG: hypothetical protein ACREPV_01180 [Lysobacter sp.]
MTSAACDGCRVMCPASKCPRPRLLPQCEDDVQAYLACRTQWTVGANGARIGMAYPGCEVAIRCAFPQAKRARRARLFAGVQVIEGALLAVQQETMAQPQGAVDG